MKKSLACCFANKLFVILAIVSLGILSCSKDSTPSYSASKIEAGLRVHISDIESYIASSKASGSTKAKDYSIEPLLTGEDTVMYLINYEDGWDLLSANKLAPQVLAMSEKGHMTVKQLLDCPPRADYINRLGEYFTSLSSEKNLTPDDRANNWMNNLSPLRFNGTLW